MAKPGWMSERDRQREIHARFKRCITCRHRGEPVGLTNNLGDGRGRVTVYKCSKHPMVRFYEDTYACTDHEHMA